MSISSSRLSPQSSLGEEPAEAAGRRLLVLLVEADVAIRQTIRRHLERFVIRREGGQMASVALVEADTAHGALSILAALTPDLVLLDLTLPEMSGYEVCEHLRTKEQLRPVPVIAISARTMPEDRAAAEESGANAFLAKPFTRDQLTEQMLTLLAPSAARNGGHDSLTNRGGSE